MPELGVDCADSVPVAGAGGLSEFGEVLGHLRGAVSEGVVDVSAFLDDLVQALEVTFGEFGLLLDGLEAFLGAVRFCLVGHEACAACEEREAEGSA